MFTNTLDLGSVIRQLKAFSDDETSYYMEQYGAGEGDETFSNLDMASTLVGYIIGTHLTLPTEPTVLPAAYFSTNHGQSVRRVLSQINEGTILNITQAYSAASEMFEIRYKIAFEANKSMDMLLNIAKGTTSYSKTKYMNSLTLMANHPQLTSLYNSLNTELSLGVQKDPQG